MNIFTATVATDIEAAVIQEFHNANVGLKRVYDEMAATVESAIDSLDRGVRPFTVGGNQMARVMEAQARYEQAANLLGSVHLTADQITVLVQADAVGVKVESETD